MAELQCWQDQTISGCSIRDLEHREMKIYIEKKNMTPRMVPITCHCTLKKLGKKGQFVCNLVKKTQGGACFFFQEGGAISKGGHDSSFERGGPLAWEGHWHGGGGGKGGGSEGGGRSEPPPRRC